MSGIRDHAIDWARQRETVMAGALTGLGADGQDLVAATADYVEIGALGLGAVHFTAAGALARNLMPVPTHWDLQKPIGITLHVLATSTTAADELLFTVKYDAVDIGDALVAANGGTKALDPVIDEITVGADAVSLAVRETSRGIIPAGKLTKGGLLALEIELESATDASDAIYLLDGCLTSCRGRPSARMRWAWTVHSVVGMTTTNEDACS